MTQPIDALTSLRHARRCAQRLLDELTEARESIAHVAADQGTDTARRLDVGRARLLESMNATRQLVRQLNELLQEAGEDG